MRNAEPDRIGSSASCCAITTWNGFTGLNADPTAAAPKLMPAAVSGSKPTRSDSRSSTGMSAMISSCVFCSTPPVAKNAAITGMTSSSRPTSARASASTAERSAPVRSTTRNAPPARKTRKMTSAASTKPRGTARNAPNGPTGEASTRSYVPATTIVRSVVSSSTRSYLPAGTTQLASAPTRMHTVSSVSGCGTGHVRASRVVPCRIHGSAECTDIPPFRGAAVKTHIAEAASAASIPTTPRPSSSHGRERCSDPESSS